MKTAIFSFFVIGCIAIHTTTSQTARASGVDRIADQNGNIEKPVGGKWKILAEQGNPNAQRILGILLEARAPNLAAEWYLKAADQGHAGAQYALGQLYAEGRGVPKDDVQASTWNRKAVEQDFFPAKVHELMTFPEKEGVDAGTLFSACSRYKNPRTRPKAQDRSAIDSQAFAWCRKAAELGYSAAQRYLGDFYSSGFGVTKDSEKAVEWYIKAAEQGNEYAQLSLANMLKHGVGVPRDQVKADYWFGKAAEKGLTNLSIFNRVQ